MNYICASSQYTFASNFSAVPADIRHTHTYTHTLSYASTPFLSSLQHCEHYYNIPLCFVCLTPIPS